MPQSAHIPIQQVSKRPTIQVHLPEDRVLEGPRGTQLGAFLALIDSPEAPIVGGTVNNELRELTFALELDAHVRPVTMAEPDGMRIYRRSLTFLLATAFEALFPDERLNVDHSVSSGGYYCQVSTRPPLTVDELRRLEERMRQLAEADLPFAKSQMPLEEAIEYFRQIGFEDKVRLLGHRRKPYLVIYELENHRDYHHGYMVPSTGYLKWFALAEAGEGFILRFPRRHRPTELLPLPEIPTLLATFQLYGDWLQKLGIASVGGLNDAIGSGRAPELILVGEALHERRIAEIAAQIDRLKDSNCVVLIAGPSSSGKTTFSKRLSIQLVASGISPFPIELDHYFVDREKTPLDEDGQYDYESVGAVDRDRLNHDLKLLISGERVRLPKYNFLTGKQEEAEVVQLAPGQIIILEGIHGLNPELVPSIPSDQTYRIYVSALTQLNLDSYNRVSTADTRLIRRIVRDAANRGYSAAETIQRWDSVRRGEKRYIFPFQGNADVMFNSALAYEGSALAPLAEPLLRQVSHGTVEHIEAKRLLAFLEWFQPIDMTLIPDNSILREFIGGSILRQFNPWHR